MIVKTWLGICSLLLLSQNITAQKSDQINWITFGQLEDSLAVNPKKVFVDFYAEWCAYCKKMDKVVFRDKEIITKLNREYYAVKMNAESTDTITFAGETFMNKQVGLERAPIHEIPILLASRTNHPFSLPSIIIFNTKFEVTHRYFEYLSPQKMKHILRIH